MFYFGTRNSLLNSGESEGIKGLINLLTGGAFTRLSIFAMSITPYITASIVIQLLGMVIPSLEKLTKEGGELERAKINRYTKILTLALSLAEGIGIYMMYKAAFINPGFLTGFVVVLSFMTGTAILMWLGEQITTKGIGNGISMLIFVGIIAGLGTGAKSLYSSVFGTAFDTKNLLVALGIIVGIIVLVSAVVFVQQAERKIPVQYSKKVVGRKMVGGQNTHIPLKLAMAGVLGGSAANIVLDYIFIFRFEMGMKGAALATCISPLISMLIMGFHFITGWNAFMLRPEPPSLKVIKNIASLGLHSLVTEVSGGIVIMVFNFVVYRMLGNIGIAAYGIIANLAIVFTAIFTGLSCGVQPLMCRIHGKQDEPSLKYLLRLSISSALVMAVAAYAIVYIKTSDLVSVFNSEGSEHLRKIAEKGLRLYFVFMPFMGINSILSVYFTSLEKPFISPFFVEHFL